MKKIISAILSAVMLFGTTAFAKIGDKIDVALNTDIVAYINNYAIPSFAVNGTSCVVAEDLRNFGFDVAWDESARSLTITRNSNTTVNPMSFSKTAKTGSYFADILETDISVYANSQKITSYAMNGYTMIPVEELTMFGDVYWVEGERALKLWVDGLHIREAMQPISKVPVTYDGFRPFANAIKSNGEYSYEYECYLYGINVEDFGITVIYAYYPGDDSISMLLSVEEPELEFSVYLDTYENETPYVEVEYIDNTTTDYFGNPRSYQAVGWFDGYDNQMAFYQLNFYEADMDENLKTIANTCLGFIDLCAVDDLGVSIKSLGINY